MSLIVSLGGLFISWIVGIKLPGDKSSPEISLYELNGLAVTAEYEPVAELTQRLNQINPKTLLGSGKVEELKQSVVHHSPEVVVFDEDLSPRQNRELEKILKCGEKSYRYISLIEIFYLFLSLEKSSRF